MGYFDHCRPDQRFTAGLRNYRFADGHGSSLLVADWDQRRTIYVHTSWAEEDDDFIFEALAKHIDIILADTTSIEVSRDGELLSCPVHGSRGLDYTSILPCGCRLSTGATKDSPFRPH